MSSPSSPQARWCWRCSHRGRSPNPRCSPACSSPPRSPRRSKSACRWHASGSTMSVSYAVDFASLLLLGADQTMLVAAASAWSQCTFRTQSKSPLLPDAVQHGVARADGEGHRPRLRAAWRRLRRLSGVRVAVAAQTAPRRCYDVLHLQHAVHCHGDQPVDTPADRANRGTRIFSGARRAISSARCSPLLPRPLSIAADTGWPRCSRRLST